MKVIKFTLNVVFSYSENGQLFPDQVKVLGVSFADATNTYYEKTAGLYELSVENVVDAELIDLPSIENYMASDEVIKMFEEDKSDIRISTTKKDSIPAKHMPFHYDTQHMYTALVRGFMMLHPGYDNPKDPTPIRYMDLYNTRTGNCVRINIADNF